MSNVAIFPTTFAHSSKAVVFTIRKNGNSYETVRVSDVAGERVIATYEYDGTEAGRVRARAMALGYAAQRAA